MDLFDEQTNSVGSTSVRLDDLARRCARRSWRPTSALTRAEARDALREKREWVILAVTVVVAVIAVF
jgi:hypothetical protein